MKNILSFDNLVISISSIHKLTSGSAKSAVNQLLTIRNWMIGYYIIEFEQHGADRAVYGSKLLLTLADKLKIKGLDRTHLNLCRIFYQKYPQISSVITHRLKNINSQIYIPLIPGEIPQENKNKKCATLSHKFETNPDVFI